MKKINETANGQITYCQGNRLFHLEFGNLFLHLTGEQLKAFQQYVSSIDDQYYLELNRNSFNKRKLMLSVGSQKVFFSVHPRELTELRQLLTINKKPVIIKNKELIDFSLAYN